MLLILTLMASSSAFVLTEAQQPSEVQQTINARDGIPDRRVGGGSRWWEHKDT